MSDGQFKGSGASSSNSKLRWFAIATAFVLTWVLVAGAIILSRSLSATPSVTSSEDEPRTTRSRVRTRGTQEKREESALLQELRKAKESGLLEDDIPSELTIFEPRKVFVRLSRGPAAERFIKDLNENNREIAPVSDSVSVSLHGGNGFDIENLSPDRQSMRRKDYGLWRFNVTPTRTGKNTLEIQVNLYDEYGAEPVASYSKQIEIEVPFTSIPLLIWTFFGGSLVNLIVPIGASLLSAWTTARMTRQPARSISKRPLKRTKKH